MKTELARVMSLSVSRQVIARATQRPTGTDRTSHQALEPIEDDEERLAMR